MLQAKEYAAQSVLSPPSYTFLYKTVSCYTKFVSHYSAFFPAHCWLRVLQPLSLKTMPSNTRQDKLLAVRCFLFHFLLIYKLKIDEIINKIVAYKNILSTFLIKYFREIKLSRLAPSMVIMAIIEKPCNSSKCEYAK